MATSAATPARVLGRYTLYDAIASGGMATVHLGRLLGPVGFARTVAIKRLHPEYARDPDFVSMFLDEARLAARISHPNVVSTLDVVATDGELFLVMEYVEGESFSSLIKAMRQAETRMPIPYAVAIVANALRGLHAAHEATDERGRPLGIVHRDVSPQNVIVGVDGVARVLDFGVAKAVGRLQTTREGQVKGKMAYMAPEQLRGDPTDRRTDVYAAGAVLWEALTGRRLFEADSDVALFGKVLEGKFAPPSAIVPELPAELDAIVVRALAASPEARFPTARDMARALDRAVPLVGASDLGEWVLATGAGRLAQRARTVSRIESDSRSSVRPPAPGAPTRAAAHDEIEDVTDHVVEGTAVTEVSGASSLRSAVLPTSRRPRLAVAVALGAAASVALASAVLALRPSRPTPHGVTASRTTPAAPSAVRTSAPAVATTPSSVPSLPSAAGEASSLPPAAPSASAAAASDARAAPVAATATSASADLPAASASQARPAPPRPPARSHRLDGVLDSRK